MKLKKTISPYVGTTIDLKNTIISLIDGSGTKNVETFTSDVQANFVTGDYISFQVGSTIHYLWFDLTGADSVPVGLASKPSGTVHVVDINGDTTAADVATTTVSVVNAIEGVTAAASTADVVITQAQFGVIVTGSDANATGITGVATTTAGVASKKVAIKVGDGNLTFSEKRNIEYLRDRGLLDETREGDEDPMDVSFQLRFEEITAVEGAPATVPDILKKRGEASNWVTSAVDDCGAPYAVDIELLHTPPCDTVAAERILLQQFRYESLDYDAKAGTIGCSGKCNISEPLSIREPQG